MACRRVLNSHKADVEALLLAKAECQPLYLILTYRIREQARSHILDRV